MTAEIQPIKSGRLLSLDAFRGMTIAGMLLVNNAGDWGHVFPPLDHAEWNGCSATDLVFPFFLFIMGVAMSFSFAKRLESAGATSALLPKIAKRTLMIFGLGAILNLIIWKAAPWIENYRWLGVLQRIAICYFAASLIAIYCKTRGQVLWTIGLLVGYYLVMKFVTIQGLGGGDFTKEGNLSTYFDTIFLGRHSYEHLESVNLFHDPEGVLSTIPAIGSTLTGLLAGHWLRGKNRDGNEKVAGLAVAGLGLFIVAALWKYDFPLNKRLWTSSYVLHTSGLGMLTLAAFYWIIDVKGIKGWSKPFVVYGVNPITAYFGASAMAYSTIAIKLTNDAGDSIFLKTFIYNTFYKSWIPVVFNDTVSSAAYGSTYVIVWCALMWVMYRKRIFIKV